MQLTYNLEHPEYIQENQSQNIFSSLQDTIALRQKKIQIARLVCQLIPASCPFTRDIVLLGHTWHIPPLCKLNPFYNYLMGLRWQALTFLADVDSENI